MAHPIIAAIEPKAVKLKQGEVVYFCRCGRSKDQPFCDGAHAGSGIEPMRFEAPADDEFYFCQCKQSGDLPLCDGTHERFAEKNVGQSLDDASASDAASNQNAKKSDANDTARDEFESEIQVRNTDAEPLLEWVHALAEQDPETFGFGPVAAMGVPRPRLPQWDDLLIVTAQLARRPLGSDESVDMLVTLGSGDRRLELASPLIVTDMSYGALSKEAKIALARGVAAAGVTHATGEGGVLPEEQAANPKLLFELGPARFGFDQVDWSRVGGFHVKAGQAAKTGIGGVLPAAKVSEEIASVRGISAGEDACSPEVDPKLLNPRDFVALFDKVREHAGAIPVGIKLAAQHVEADLAFVLECGVDYVVIDGRGGGTAAAPQWLRDHSGVPLQHAIARARDFIDRHADGAGVRLIATGGLRTPMDVVKALALGADAVALGTAAMQAVGCIGARICHTNRCPVGVATQDPELRSRLDVDKASQRVDRFLRNSAAIVERFARVCGHARVAEFSRDDLVTTNPALSDALGVSNAGVDRTEMNRGWPMPGATSQR